MRPALLSLFAVGLVAVAVAAPVPKGVKTRAEAELFEGRWEVVTIDRGDGPHKPARNIATFQWVFRDGKLLVGSANDDQPTPNVFELDSSVTPRQLDIKQVNASTSLAIYELEGDTLRLCVGQPDQPRPTEFKGSVRADSYVLKRVKDQ